MLARRSTVSSLTLHIITYQLFRVQLKIFILILCLGDWRSSLAQQHLPSAIMPDSQAPSQLGKNHLHGIRRLSAASQENAWEHRHLRHIPSPMEPIKRPLPLNNQMVINGGGEPRPPTAQRVPVPLKEAPSPVLEEVDERMVLGLSSAEAENLAQKLLQNAGMNEQELAQEELQQRPEMIPPHQRSNRKGSSAAERKNNNLTKPPLSSSTSLHSTEESTDSTLGGERKRMDRIQSRWRKIGPLLKTNTSSLLPLRRLRLVQHRRKLLQKDSRQRLQQQKSSPLPTPVPLHAATVEKATNLAQSTTIISTEMTTTESSLMPSSTPKAAGAPRARQMAAAANSAKRHRIAAAEERHQQQELNKENDDNFDFESARHALIEAQKRQQQQHPRGWQPAERMLRHRHRIRFEQQQQRQRQRRPPIFNGPLLGRANERGDEASIDGQHQRQFGLKTEWRDGQRGNRLEELLKEDEQQQQLTRPESAASAVSTPSHNNRRLVQEERRFRLVPNKVIFRPRLKIRRPTGHSESNAGGEALARGTDQQRSGQQPIALPSLSTFESASDSAAQPVPVPPAPEEPPLRVAAPPPPPEPAPIEPPATASPLPPPPSSSPAAQPLPALEVGSIGEQPPQNIQGGMPTMPSPETTAATTQVVETKQAPSENTAGSSDIVLGEDEQQAAGSGLVGGASPETGPLPPGFSDGSGFIGGGGGDNGLAFGAELGTPPPGFKEAFGLNGFETSIGSFGAETTTVSSISTSQTSSTVVSSTTPAPATTTTASTTTVAPTTTTTTPSTTPPPPPSPPPPSPPIEEVFIIPENSGLRPVSPPKEFQGGGGFGSHGSVVGSSRGGGFGGGGGRILEPPPPNAQVEPPQQPLKPEDFFTGESAFTPNKRGPEGDGYGPSVLPGAPIPPAPAGPAIGVGGAAAGIPLPPIRPLPNAIGGAAAVPPEPPVENEATTVKPSALLNFLNKADEGFNQVITHFERGTPLEAAAIDIMEVALGSQKLDSQAKLLSHVDRAIGLDNLQRLQRWANTGGAFDLIKEQFAKIAKNYKPAPETANLFTVPPQLEYLFQPGSSSSGKKRRRKR